jgi:hypothetical protein
MNKPFQTVKMHGPCLKGSGKTVNADVAEGNVRAFIAAGYKMGSVEIEPEVQIAEMVVEDAPKPKSKKK